MEELRGGRPDSERLANLKLAFSVATHRLLTACPREEFERHLSILKPHQQNALYELYSQMIVSVKENLEDEFRDICEETRVETACDDELLLRHSNARRQRIMSMGKEAIIKAKANELEYLRHTLSMVKEQNHDYGLKLKALKDDLETSRSAAQTDAVLTKLKELNAKLGFAVAKKKSMEVDSLCRAFDGHLELPM